MNWIIIELFVLIELSLSLAPSEVIIIILSQPDEYNIKLAEELRSNIYNQSTLISKENFIEVHFSHEIFNQPGYWTFLLTLPYFQSTNLIKTTTKWIVLCEDRSTIDLRKLIENLHSQDHKKITYYGYPLRDEEATIIHHFAFFENPQWFSYPLLRSGVVFTVPLIKRLVKHVQRERPTMDFFIDASHELSLFIWQNIKIQENNKTNEAPTPTIASSLLSAESNTIPSSNIQPYSKEKLFNENDIDNTISMVTESNSKKSLSNSQHQLNKNRITNAEKNQNSKEITQKYIKQEKGHDKKFGNHIDNSVNPNNVANTKDYGHHKQSNETESNEAQTWHKLKLTAVPYLCARKTTDCAIFPNENIVPCNPIRLEAIYFAIKTCHKFHKDRIPTIEITWGQYALHKRYFSDIADNTIPTISTGVPNTETGHCAKTLSIFELALEDINKINRIQRERRKPVIEWLFLSDDDTILSVSAICNILGCYNPDNDIYLGERYGYRLHSKDGFNYITGGGGIAFSLSTVRKIVTSCTCPTISSPDDMIIGVCLQRLGIKAIHSSRFHQARSLDYSPILLDMEEPISFHKFWQINPIKVYKKWFKKSDEELFSYTSPTPATSHVMHLKSKTTENKNNCDIHSSHSTNTKIIKNYQNGNSLGNNKNNNDRSDIKENTKISFNEEKIKSHHNEL